MNEDDGDKGHDDLTGYERARRCLQTGSYDQVLPACNQELDQANGANGEAGDAVRKHQQEARVLRATFLILSKRQDEAMADLEAVIEDETASSSLRANALIKRASLYIQQCKDPEKDPLLSLKDFERA